MRSQGYPAYRQSRSLLTTGEVAEILTVSRSTVRRLVRTGELVNVRVGRSVRFRPADVDDLIRRGAKGLQQPEAKHEGSAYVD